MLVVYGKMCSYIQRNFSHSSPLFQWHYQGLFSLYTIEWSPYGSNKTSKEEETIYCWELYLKHIEGVCNEIL